MKTFTQAQAGRLEEPLSGLIGTAGATGPNRTFLTTSFLRGRIPSNNLREQLFVVNRG